MEIIEVCLEREKRIEREAWRRARWQTMHMLNIEGKYLKHDIHDPKQLLRLDDEIKPPVSPEERERQSKENLRFLKSKFWTKFRTNPDGSIHIFDEEDYKRLSKKDN